MFQIEGNVAGGMKTLLGFFLQAVLHDRSAREKHCDWFRSDRRIFFQDGAHRIGCSVAVEGAFAGIIS